MAAASNHAAAIGDLEAVFGGPSSEGFGSAVFSDILESDEDGDLERTALDVYRRFVGELWDRWGEDAWMAPWKQVYVRPANGRPDVVAELTGLADPSAKISVPLIVEAGPDSERTHAALASAFDDPAVTELRVYVIGDGEAMSGLLVAGRCAASNVAVFVAALMD